MDYKGSKNPPKYKHEQLVEAGGVFGKIQHRREHLGSWEYGILMEIEETTHILWFREDQIKLIK